MRSTKKKTAAKCIYLGVDITDRYADSRREMDVCGLEIADKGLIPHFWTWAWGSSDPLVVTDLLPEISDAKATMLDGPQGLARVGRSIRTSERFLAAAAKTPDTRPPLSQPYSGFVASSLDLFAAFHSAGLFDPSSPDRQIHEVYPAAIWTRLARRLPNKRHRDGRQARVAILRALGVAVPDAPSHDELDACAAALLAAAAHGHIQGVGIAAVGDPVYWDDDEACLREGQILVPEVGADMITKLRSVVRPWVASPEVRPPRSVQQRAPLALREVGESSSAVRRPILDGATPEDRTGQLLDLLASELLAGSPTLCTYKAAVQVVLGYEKFTPAYLSILLKLATSTGRFEVDSLGEIKLDTFLVNQKHRPGKGHWKSAKYSPAEWDRAFSAASVIE